ncbi:MAG: hypothetical protein ACRDDZ_02890 [Marinifilaceae bacterium]
MRYILTLLLITYSALTLNATVHNVQQQIVDALIISGYENVSIVHCTECTAVTIDINQYKCKRDGVSNALSIIKNIAPNDNIVLVILRNGIPYVQIPVNNYTSASYTLPKGFIQQQRKPINRNIGKVDFVFFPQIGIRNQKFHKVYDVVVNINPAIEVVPWKGALITAEVIIPVVNQYGPTYDEIRPGILTLSQRFRFENIFGNFTIGNFNQNRWGADLYLFRPFKTPALNRFALSGRLGFTGYSQFFEGEWNGSLPDLWTGSIGLHYFNKRYNSELIVRAISYIDTDKGIRADIIRHFKHVSIGLYAMRNNANSIDGGFHFAIMLPPYKTKKHRAVNVNTTDYFDFELQAAGLFKQGKEYKTSRRMFPAQEQWNPWSLTNFSL